MEEEIPLRLYIDALMQYWKFVVIMTMGVAGAALLVSFALSPAYRAVALVAVTESRQVVQFDPRFAADNINQPLAAYPELAMSDELLQTLLENQREALDSVQSITQLRDAVSAQAGSDPSLIRLAVELEKPELAALVANEWASLFVRWANDVYGDQGGEQVRFFEQQLAQATQELGVAEKAVIDFQKENRSAILTNELNALKDQQAQALGSQQVLLLILNDVIRLREQFEVGGQQTPATFGDEMTALALQLKVYNAENGLPVQVQVDTLSAGAATSRRELVELLAQLAETLELNLAQIDETLAGLEPQILILQEEKQVSETKSGRLSQNLTIAQETYVSLSRKVEEERITAQDTSSGVRLASRATEPTKPTSPRKLLNTVIGGVFGLLMGVFFVFAREWWRTSK